MGMFALLFAVLFTGVSMAFHYYKESLNRVRAEQELTLARRIQRSFLMTQFPELPRIELHALNLSSKEVSGDFYDVVPAGDGSYLLAIADVAGKGVPAALLTSMLQASLRTQAGVTRSVAEILTNINRLVYRSTTVNQFATFFLARIDETSLRMSFSNAGHNWPIVFRDGGEREFLVKGGVVVGILEDATFEEETIELKPGDRLVFYTDGVSEAQDPKGELFGEDRLYDLISSLPRHLSAREVTDAIVARVNEYLGGAEAGDDITLMVLRVREPAEIPLAGVPAAASPAGLRN
jgi:phosphoserine phosphatase RsbU/P